MYIYIYIYLLLFIYIYIHNRERERDVFACVGVSVSILYMYICVCGNHDDYLRIYSTSSSKSKGATEVLPEKIVLSKVLPKFFSVWRIPGKLLHSHSGIKTRNT